MNKEKTHKILHIYTRGHMGIPEQRTELKMQGEAGIKRAKKLGYKYEIFVETPAITELQRLIGLMKEGKVTDVFVTDIDRLAFSIELILELDKMFELHGITLHAGNRRVDMRNSEQSFMKFFQALLEKEYKREHKSF